MRRKSPARAICFNSHLRVGGVPSPTSAAITWTGFNSHLRVGGVKSSGEKSDSPFVSILTSAWEVSSVANLFVDKYVWFQFSPPRGRCPLKWMSTLSCAP